MLQVGHALSFNTVEDHHARTGIRRRNRLNDLQQPGNVIAFHGDNIKTESAEFPFQIERANNLIQFAVQLLLVPVDKHRQVVQAMMGDKLKRFPALPFIQLAVADDTKYPIRAPGKFVRQRHPPGNRDPLPQ